MTCWSGKEIFEDITVASNTKEPPNTSVISEGEEEENCTCDVTEVWPNLST